MVRQASLFSQLLQQVPRDQFDQLVRKNAAEKGAKGFTCWTQFVAMLFCHLGRADSLRMSTIAGMTRPTPNVSNTIAITITQQEDSVAPFASGKNSPDSARGRGIVTGLVTHKHSVSRVVSRIRGLVAARVY